MRRSLLFRIDNTTPIPHWRAVMASTKKLKKEIKSRQSKIAKHEGILKKLKKKLKKKKK
jgi:alkylated DNA nucleotide flippase Atl1